VDIYVRVSRVGGRDVDADGGTASEQEKRCRAQLVAEGLKAGEVFKDLDQSGGKTSRPAFDQVKERIGSGISGGMIVTSLSRFGRNRRVDEDILELEKLGGTVISIEDKLDTSTPSGRFALTILSAVNTLYLENVTEAWQRAHVNHIAKGVMTGRAPAGYSKREDGTLEPNEFAPVIVEASEMRANGASVGKVRDFLNTRGVPTSGKANRWQERTTSRLLKNPTYTGQARFGDLVKENAHPAIIDPLLWKKVQRTFAKGAPRGSRKPKALLAGILRCAACGTTMKRDSSRKKNSSGNVRLYPFYRCRSETCTAKPTIGAVMTEQLIVRAALDKYGTLRFQNAVSNEDTLALALANQERAQRELAEMEEMIGAKLPADAKQIQAVHAAEEALAEAREGGELIKWAIPADVEGDYSPKTVLTAEDGTVITKVSGTTADYFNRKDREWQRGFLAHMIEQATVKTTSNGHTRSPDPVEKRVSIEWKERP
jgi:DNA invertase Pin-like site-specific DNA recombinase